MIKESIKNVLDIEGNEILLLKEKQGDDQLEILVERLAKHQKNIFFTACGTSAMAAKKIWSSGFARQDITAKGSCHDRNCSS